MSETPQTPQTLSAEQLDNMTPDERKQAFQERIVTDEAALPADFRERVYERAKRLGNRPAKNAG